MRHEAKKQVREFTQAVNANAQDAMATLEDLDHLGRLRLEPGNTPPGLLTGDSNAARGWETRKSGRQA